MGDIMDKEYHHEYFQKNSVSITVLTVLLTTE